MPLSIVSSNIHPLAVKMHGGNQFFNGFLRGINMSAGSLLPEFETKEEAQAKSPWGIIKEP